MQLETLQATRSPVPSAAPKVAHYLCFSLQCRVPLLPKFAVPLSQQFRAAANSHLCRVYGDGAESFALLGHGARPSDAQGDHQHAFYLPMSKWERNSKTRRLELDPNCHLSDLHIWCPYGFKQAEIEILLRIQRLNWGSGRYPVRPVLTAISKEPPSDAPFSTGKTKSTLWRSVSPFVPPRYFYRRDGNRVTLKERDRPERQLADCLRAAGISVPGEIRRHPIMKDHVEGGQPRWEVVRTQIGEEDAAGTSLVSVSVHRNGSSKQGGMEQRVGMFFEIEFEAPVSFPIPALGHSCHFGLGLFVPVETCGA